MVKEKRNEKKEYAKEGMNQELVRKGGMKREGK